MIRHLATAIILVLGLLWHGAAYAQPVVLVFTSGSDVDLKIAYRAKPGGGLKNLLSEMVDGERVWTYTTPQPPTEWMARPVFTIRFPARDVAELKLDPMSVTLAFDLRAMLEDEEIRIPIVPIQSVSDAEFGQVETMSAEDRYAKILMMKQFAAHYIVNAGQMQTKFGARIARAWFAAQWGGIMRPRTPEERLALRLDSDLLSALSLALPSDDPAWPDFNARIREWQAAFWNIPGGDFQTVMRRGACDVGPLVINYVTERSGDYDVAQAVRGVNASEQIAEMERRVKLCRETRIATGN